mmetsp:Transcript_735/g.1024  ORF Transcript_735/g.1024 Transcript_735/m.1024 type:complete len:110 (-) Transcript_735:114-443(-)
MNDTILHKNQISSPANKLVQSQWQIEDSEILVKTDTAAEVVMTIQQLRLHSVLSMLQRPMCACKAPIANETTAQRMHPTANQHERSLPASTASNSQVIFPRTSDHCRVG